MAARYWVGGAGTWDASSTTNWSATSGGASGASVPILSDNVTFDAASNATAYTCTISSNGSCQNITFGNPASGVITLAGSSEILCYRDFTWASGMTRTHTGRVQFLGGSATQKITSNGISFSSVYFGNSGGTWTLQDNMICAGDFWRNAGTFVPNGKTVTLTKTNPVLTGTITFYNLTYVGPASQFGYFNVTNDITITNLLTLTGNSAINRIIVRGFTLGTRTTITTANASISYADFKDITGAGAYGWNLSAITGLSGNCGNNSGITFTSLLTLYWYNNTGNFSNATKWFLATGGTGGAGRIPLPQDTARFDASSFNAGTKVITFDIARASAIDFTGSTNTPDFKVSIAFSIFGNLTLISAMTASSTSGYTITFEGRNGSIINIDNLSLNNAIKIECPASYVTLASNVTLTGTNRIFTVSTGTFNAVSYNITAGAIDSSFSTTRVINMGSGTWEAQYTGTIWNFATTTNLTLNSNTSTVKFTDNSATNKTFSGGIKIYYNFWDATLGTGFVDIVNSNTFNDFKINAGRTIRFTAGTTTSMTSFSPQGSAGNLVTIASVTAASHNLLKLGGGLVSCNYMSIFRSTVAQLDTWYAGANSTDNGTNSGWIFTAPPALTYKPQVIIVD